MKRMLLGGALALVAAAASAEDCGPESIGIEGVKGRIDGDYMYVTGKLINRCNIATGVQIKVSVYDNSGDVVTVYDPWPDSTNNIPAGSDFPFEVMIRRVPGAAKFDVRVIDTRVWRK